MPRAFTVCLALAFLGTAAAAAEPGPETIGGRGAAEWRAAAGAREDAVTQLEAKLASCEEHEAPPAYRNVPGQVFHGRAGLRYREVARCDGLRAELAAAQDALDRFEDDARRLGVPPGWLRD